MGSNLWRSSLGCLQHDDGIFATRKNPLLHVCDPYDAALGLRVLWVLDYSHV
jgi:hypothetical protein